MRPHTLAPVVFLCAAACHAGPASRSGDDPPPAEPEPAERQAPPRDAPAPIRTDQAVYTLLRDPRYAVYEAWAQVTYTNRGSAPVYLQVCRGARAPHYWVVAGEAEGGSSVGLTEACARGEGGSRVRVAPGESRSDSVRLVAAAGQRPPEGTYRFEAAVYDRDGGGSEGRLPEAERRSNPFRVRYEG